MRCGIQGEVHDELDPGQDSDRQPAAAGQSIAEQPAGGSECEKLRNHRE